jgi:hypothetical protein
VETINETGSYSGPMRHLDPFHHLNRAGSPSSPLGVGYSWGHGVLSYKGRDYPFTVKGLSALGIGASSIDGTAEVFKLKSLADFEGVYGAAGVGATVGPIGAGTGGLTNRKGVELRLNTQSEGLELTLALSGVTIEFDK